MLSCLSSTWSYFVLVARVFPRLLRLTAAQDVKKGKLRHVDDVHPYSGYIWNYGAFPQVRASPVQALTLCGCEALPHDASGCAHLLLRLCCFVEQCGAALPC